jgi:hypothetical protein
MEYVILAGVLFLTLIKRPPDYLTEDYKLLSVKITS